jgi:hypothetical protein
MAQTVFILGAGASKQGGAPLMMEFLDAADLAFKAGRVAAADKEHFERVFRGVGKLQQVQSKQGSLDLVNIESVFGAFEMARTLGKLPGFDVKEIDLLLPSMVRLIVRTLELNLAFRRGHNETEILPPTPYDDFVELLQQLKAKAKPPHTVAVLTFNYDAALDWAITREWLMRGGRSKAVFYGLEGGSAPPESITLLKLHGSVNWFACDGAGTHDEHVAEWPISEALQHANQSRGVHAWDVLYSMDFSAFKDHSVSAPLIVPPTWSKGEYYRQLGKVWSHAAQELGEAENIIVIGYSLPRSDSFFPLLFGLGTVGDQPLRRFWVFDPDEKVGDRFREMLGPGAQQRFKHFATHRLRDPQVPNAVVPMRFDHAIKELKERLQVG